MWKGRFSEDQIIYALRRADSVEAVTETCRELGVSQRAFYFWRSKYKWMRTMKKRLRRLEEENHKLKWLLADFSPHKDILQEELSRAVLPGNWNQAINDLDDRPVKPQNSGVPKGIR